MIHWILHHIGPLIAVGFWASIVGGLFLEWLDFRDKPPSEW